MDINGKLYCSRCMLPMETDGPCPHCGYEGSQARDTSVLEEGTLLNGRYQLGAVIGQGGFGITYAAWDESLERPVAIKEYFPSDYVKRNIDNSDDVEFKEENKAEYLDGLLRFERESRVLVQLRGNPNIVEVLDAFSENNTAYIVMEYIHGVTLTEWMKGRKIKPDDLLKLMRPVMDALVMLHKQGIVHRDIKPDNMLVDENGSIRLIDFGAALETARRGKTIILSRGYAPVEQYEKEAGRQGPWSDVYAYGAVLYELLTGQPPQESITRKQKDDMKSPAAMGVKLGKKQNAALMSALAVPPEKRTQSMEEFRARLYNLPLPEEVLWRKKTMRRVAISFAMLFVVMMIIVANYTLGFPLEQGLLYSLRGDGWHILKEYTHQRERQLPDHVCGIPVSQVENGAFRESPELLKVTVPGSIWKIGDAAFYHCPLLRYVALEEGVSTIGAGSFAACEKLSVAIVPASLNEIPIDAFPATFEKRKQELDLLWDEELKKNELEIKNEEANIASFAQEIQERIEELEKTNELEKIKELVGQDIAATSSFLLAPFYGFVLYGYSGSTAEAFASDYGIEFQPITMSFEETVNYIQQKYQQE